MEFLRFGSSIPGGYWGCCACCIIQNFKVDPDAKASIQLVSGDGGGGITAPGGGFLFAGPTYRDIFEQRIRSGTFDNRDMPNHAFIAILTDWQVTSGVGKKWMEILKQHGFEFIRTVSNSVYTGNKVGGTCSDQSKNYIFGLFRNIGDGGTIDQFQPPKEWLDAPSVKTEVWQTMFRGDICVSDPSAVKADGTPLGKEGMIDIINTTDLTKRQRAEDTAIWKSRKPGKFLTEAEVLAAGASITLSGLRVDYAKPMDPTTRATLKAKAEGKKAPANPNPFGKTSKAAPVATPVLDIEAMEFPDNGFSEDDDGECFCGNPDCALNN